jgi:hypothetical protein
VLPSPYSWLRPFGPLSQVFIRLRRPCPLTIARVLHDPGSSCAAGVPVDRQSIEQSAEYVLQLDGRLLARQPSWLATLNEVVRSSYDLPIPISILMLITHVIIPNTFPQLTPFSRNLSHVLFSLSVRRTWEFHTLSEGTSIVRSVNADIVCRTWRGV